MTTIGRTNPNARPLRLHATDAERQLWAHLRNRQLGGCKFRRQATVGPYIVDFLCLDAGLVVEADGGQHDETRDRVGTAWLEARGLRVLRFWNNDILDNMDGVLEAILQAVGQGPSPNPLPRAGEG